jgi:DNA-directed RNA polymerase specialized sigma24 family protein
LTDVPVTFADMMRQHWKGVWSFVYTIVRRSEVADDLTQETFIRAYQHWGEYRGESSLKTWLFTIAKILNISEGNARVQYHRAIQKLKDKLQAEVLSGEL